MRCFHCMLYIICQHTYWRVFLVVKLSGRRAHIEFWQCGGSQAYFQSRLFLTQNTVKNIQTLKTREISRSFLSMHTSMNESETFLAPKPVIFLSVFQCHFRHNKKACTCPAWKNIRVSWKFEFLVVLCFLPSKSSFKMDLKNICILIRILLIHSNFTPCWRCAN